MFLIGLIVGTITGGAGVLCGVILTYRLAQIHAREED